jgi:hypothetical protein
VLAGKNALGLSVSHHLSGRTRLSSIIVLASALLASMIDDAGILTDLVPGISSAISIHSCVMISRTGAGSSNLSMPSR